ncbi:MAG: hypothetical protein HKN79_03145 [Flavobacteriales bacterium]|nr:hypothetical protein [Flavobacteriales bacterium]
MSIQRRCPDCNTWNAGGSHCQTCGKILDPELLREEADLRRSQEKAPAAGHLLDTFFDRMKNSDWLIIRGLYWLGYSVWFVFFSIISFFMFLIAWTPG